MGIFSWWRQRRASKRQLAELRNEVTLSRVIEWLMDLGACDEAIKWVKNQCDVYPQVGWDRLWLISRPAYQFWLIGRLDCPEEVRNNILKEIKEEFESGIWATEINYYANSLMGAYDYECVEDRADDFGEMAELIGYEFSTYLLDKYLKEIPPIGSK